jgi:hypothetical protein
MSFYNPLPVNKLMGLFNLEEKDFVTSDYCTECDGDGVDKVDGGQCFSCEELHAQELRADRLMDEAKGN